MRLAINRQGRTKISCLPCGSSLLAREGHSFRIATVPRKSAGINAGTETEKQSTSRDALMHPPSSSLHASQTHAPRGLYFLSLLGLLSFLGLPAAAQTRPLRTTEAEVLPPGTLRAQVGFDFLQEVDFPTCARSVPGGRTSASVVRSGR